MKEMNQAQNLSGAILFFFICLFVYTKLVGPIPFTVTSIQTVKGNLFTSNGSGEEKATPDTAMVSLGVTVHAATADEAKNQMNQVTNKVVADLKALGIAQKDIRTTGLSVYEDPSSEPVTLKESGTSVVMSEPAVGPKKIEAGIAAPVEIPQISPPSLKKGSFTGSETITVSAKSIDEANKAIDVASADGANALGTPYMTINDDKRKELTKKARAKAIADAKKNAEELASEAGIKLGKVIDVQDSSGGGNFKYAAMDRAVPLAGGGEPTQLNPGEDTISVTVTLSYETL